MEILLELNVMDVFILIVVELRVDNRVRISVSVEINVSQPLIHAILINIDCNGKRCQRGSKFSQKRMANIQILNEISC